MKNLIIEPSEYVAKYASPYLADMVEALYHEGAST